MTVSDLPIEILTQIFYHVKSNADLLQCQQTCRCWYQASKESLYESIYFGSEPRTSALMRTLNDSPNLGKFIKNVQFNRGKANLDTPSAQQLLQLCSNIENISAFVPDDAFYKGLVQAARQGQLSCLQRLPDHHSGSVESMEVYLNVALEFQTTLKGLAYDQMIYSDLGGDMHLKIYSKLAQNLKRFKELQDLKIVRVASFFGRGLCDLDPLIQDVPLLKTLTAVFYPTNHFRGPLPTDVFTSMHGAPLAGDIFSTISNKDIKPRPDIESFYGIWESMNTDDVVTYFMAKFTNLKMVNIGYLRDPPQPYDISLPVVYKWIEYLSKIPSVKVECALKKKEALDAWIQFIQNDPSGKKIGITYEWVSNLDHYKLTFRKKKDTSLTVTISYPEGSMDLPHKDILEKVGQHIERILISNMQNIQRNISSRRDNPQQYDMVYGHWLSHLLHNCLSLKDLLIYTPGKIRLDDSNMEQHQALEKLSISHVYAEIGDTVLPDLSRRLPSLKYLDLFYFGERNEVTTIQMPDSSLDTITWGKRSHYVGIGTVTTQENWKFYLKVKTATQEQFFMGDKVRLYPSDQEAYTNALQERQCFDIQCKSIKHLVIRYKDSFVDQKYTLDMI